MKLKRSVRCLATVAAGAVVAATLQISTAQGATPGEQVQPIDWTTFGTYAGTDAMGQRTKTILANESRYLIGPAYASKYTAYAADGYLNLGGKAEEAVRLPAMTALSAAIALKLGVYNPVNLSAANATTRDVNLIRTVAARHKANNTDSATAWGSGWQTSLWAYYDGMAAWLMWDKLSATDRDKVVNMLVAEANRFTTGNATFLIGTSGQELYMTRKDGTSADAGDSKVEENQWSAALLGLATAMMPDHPQATAWSTRHKELLVAATARPADLTNPATINGIQLSTWLKGSNIGDDGTVINHGLLHPLYMILDQGLNEAATAGLAKKCAPVAALRNTNFVYDALVDKRYPTSNGGTNTVYQPNSANIFYPQGNDWGTTFAGYFGGFDALVSIHGQDGLVATKASTWEKLHNDAQIALQARHADGHTYANNSENSYFGKEQRIGVISGLSYLSLWLNGNSAGDKACWS
ncbi:hypothetical protein [Streptomyces sp. NBC_00347]|uniref:hypothetical protein n=1 Tax=Streptomyces sp. NBC_00347 TaxID=2975721 RepID=UPI002250F58B|nr:hypothetical protein [Streptomyces sp. NBC_00347]MCX5126725.1 hypothetical protein [Streptomyces sp. NBC_00347]